MSAPGGAEPGWYADPHGRRGRRWWDGRAWTDQVADEGRTGIDPPGPATPPPVEGGPRRPSVGLLAVLAVAVVAVAGLVIALRPGDDDEPAGSSGSAADEAAADGDDAHDAMAVEGTIEDDQRAVVAGIDREAGDAVGADEPEGVQFEDFCGEDPEDVTNHGPTLCDPDTLGGVRAGEFNGDFTNDFGGGEA